MVFSSFTFMAFFLPAVICLHFLSKNPKWRNGILLVFSLLFYAWGEPRLVFLMLLSVAVNYFAALFCVRTERPTVRSLWMLLVVESDSLQMPLLVSLQQQQMSWLSLEW